MQFLRFRVAEFWNDTDGQDLIEYSLLLAFIALAVLTILSGTRKSITSLWSEIGSTLNSAVTSAAS